MPTLKFDLSEHSDPEHLVESARQNFPDKNVNFSLDGTNMMVEISTEIPTQLAADISSQISKFHKESLYPLPMLP